jgi:hypothetical protein
VLLHIVCGPVFQAKEEIKLRDIIGCDSHSPIMVAVFALNNYFNLILVSDIGKIKHRVFCVAY